MGETSTIPATPWDTQWPADGLESVSKCPVCGSARRELAYEGLADRIFRCAPGLWKLQCCGDCGSAYLDPRPTASTISMAYANYYTHAQTGGVKTGRDSWLGRRRIAQRNHFLNKNYGYDLKPSNASLFLTATRQRRFDRYTGYLSFPGSGAHFLDVGCGNGSFLAQMRSLGWEVCGVEPDPKSAGQARAAGLDVRIGGLRESGLPERSFDAVYLSHVIEHLHEPVETLRLCWKLLKPGGKIAIFTPNYNAAGRLRFGALWRGLEPPRHLVMFTEQSLWQAMERCGFSVSRVTRPALNAKPMFRMSCLLKDEYQTRGQKPRLPWYVRLQIDWVAIMANRAAKANPRSAEELILLGTKTG